MLKLFSLFTFIRRFGVRKTYRTITGLPRYIRFYMGLFKDPRTPALAKALLIGTAVYLVSPLDVLPDVIPFLGQLDDLALLGFALNRFTAMCPAHVRYEHEVAAGLAEPLTVRVKRRS
ncbi:MAG: DUF1232 domain-containing protein [Armatimonadetes bacterium]|nr:DUF1232 domain-containing protein [Armatimonadota bacterium]